MTPDRRRTRERAILHIIGSRPIRSQIELVAALAREGISTTQTTLSRDFQRLGIVKRPGPGGPRYQRPGRDTAPPDPHRMLAATLSELALDIGPGNALFAIRTMSGCANAVAIALDEADLDGVLATVAGDDTILVLCRDAEIRSRLVDELRSLANL
ncbi:MAG: arginine repressor [Gemmatimonadales bacterium]|nr:arginine repressor [Candidatus Palauibacter irciniicola]MYC17361.1 arginine repressor [Gemmatimonadales bacterium]